jgi:hypothetical protein
MSTYSFLDSMVAISGPNGAFSIGGPDVGSSEGGVTIVFTEDKNTMTIGGGGDGMHSLHAGKSGTLTVRELKTAPVNAKLSTMYKLDTVSGRQHGKNTISIRDLARGDVITASECAFAKFPDTTYAKDGGEMVWTFHAIRIDVDLGDGTELGLAA